MHYAQFKKKVIVRRSEGLSKSGDETSKSAGT
jgi:hypothetical protein